MADYKANGVIGDYMVYRDKPLVRQGNMYCYGDMKDDYVLFLLVFTTKKSEINGEEIPAELSKAKRVKLYKEKVKSLFPMVSKKYPRWVQEAEWPISSTGKI